MFIQSSSLKVLYFPAFWLSKSLTNSQQQQQNLIPTVLGKAMKSQQIIQGQPHVLFSSIFFFSNG